MSTPLTIPCCLKSICPGDGPIQNLSAEDGDGPSFIGFNWGGQNIPPVGTVYGDPPGNPCFTTDSNQFAADTSAQRCQVRHDTDDPGGGGGDWNPPPPTFGNTAQTCTVRCADGLPFNYTIPAGTYLALNQITANNIAHSFACQFAALNKVCLSTLSGSGCLNQFYNDTIIPLGRAPFTFTITSGSLPPGLTFSSNPTFARIQGTPTTIGLYTFQVRAVSANGNFMQKTFRISVLDITNKDAAPQMSAGNFFTFQVVGVGGMGPYTFSSDDLPEFLSISSDGLISGIASDSGLLDATVTITDTLGNSCDFGVTSSPACPGFDKLVWNAQFVVPAAPPPNSSSFTATEAGKNNEINASAFMAVVPGQPFVYINSAQTTDLTTEEMECIITLNVISEVGGGYGPTPGGHGGWTMEVQVFANNAPFTTFLDVKSGIDFGPGAGVYSFPITVPAGTQLGAFIGMNVGYGQVDFGPITGAIDVLVTFGS
jgi:hypothetical protein